MAAALSGEGQQTDRDGGLHKAEGCRHRRHRRHVSPHTRKLSVTVFIQGRRQSSDAYDAYTATRLDLRAGRKPAHQRRGEMTKTSNEIVEKFLESRKELGRQIDPETA